MRLPLLFIAVFLAACASAASPQAQNPGTGATYYTPYYIPASLPGLLFNGTASDASGGARTCSVIDAVGNVYWLRQGVYLWAPKDNQIHGPYLTDHPNVGSFGYVCPVLSADSLDLIIGFNAGENAVVISVDIATMITTDNSTLAVNWAWSPTTPTLFYEDEETVNYLSADANRIYVSSAYSRLAAVGFDGVQKWLVNTESIIARQSSAAPYTDGRAMMHPDGAQLLWERGDGFFFSFNPATGALLWQFNLTAVDPCSSSGSDLKRGSSCQWSDANGWSVDAATGRIFITSTRDSAVGYTNAVILTAQGAEVMRFRIGGTSDMWGSGCLQVDNEYICINDDGWSVNLLNGTMIEYNSNEDVVSTEARWYIDNNKRIAFGSYQTERAIVVWNAAKREPFYTIYGPGSDSGGGISIGKRGFNPRVWTISQGVTLDATGRFVASEGNEFFVFGCPFGQSVFPDGTCKTGCRDGYTMIENSCVADEITVVPPVLAPRSSAATTVLSFLSVVACIVAYVF